MIKLYQFPPAFGLPNASPFCLKLETYLRMVGLPYETVPMMDPRKAPKGKVPYIEDGAATVADTSFIIAYLKEKYGDKLAAGLGPEQQAISLAMQRLIEEHLYWANVYSRFIDEANWPISNKAFFSTFPVPLRFIVPAVFRGQIRKQLAGHGLGRHSRDEVYRLGCDDLSALSAFLGTKPYFMGERPSELDASAYGLLAQVLWTPTAPVLKAHAEKLPNLGQFCERMKKTFYA